MGMEILSAEAQSETDASVLTSRPSILLVGPRNVGKRSILNRLTNGASSGTSSSGLSCHGWVIDTKYYTASVCIWVGRIESKQVDEDRRMNSLIGHCDALVVVFDLSDPSSFEAIQGWVDGAPLQTFEILVCVGNKADRVPDHYGHVEYRRRLQKRGESFSDSNPDFMNYGLERTEGSSLLQENQECYEDRRRASIEWCSDRGIEYIEACALNDTFDQCLSVDGDSQGIIRLHGALSAHMWPGLVMKPLQKLGDALTSSAAEEVSSDDESEFTIEYELLSNASGEEVWDRDEDQLGLSDIDSTIVVTGSDAESHHPGTAAPHGVHADGSNDVSEQTTSGSPFQAAQPRGHNTMELASGAQGNGPVLESRQIGSPPDQRGLGVDDLERMMQDMVGLRENMRTMSDTHRREMAATCAMRMAAMFEGDDDEDLE